jgi:hypothetical protein
VLAHLRLVTAEVTAADVVDSNGEHLAGIAVELEQRRLLAAAESPPSGTATLVALGTDVTVQENPEAVETFRQQTEVGARDGDGAHAWLVATLLRAERRNRVPGRLAGAAARCTPSAGAEEVRLAPRLTVRPTLAGVRAGRSFQATIDPDGPERARGGLVEPARRGRPALRLPASSIGAEPMLGSVYRVIRDAVSVSFDMIYWLWQSLWSLNRGVIRAMLPGQSKAVHVIVTYLAVMLEIVGLWVAAVHWAAVN